MSDLPDLDGRTAFGRYLKPRLLKLLSGIRLDVDYRRGEGDYLWYRDEKGQVRKVLDMLGGYGASLLGHNHPEIVERAKELMDTRRPFNAQASVRSYAGLLAKRLSERVGRFTGREYVVTLANSGTEAVEAAIKHAELEYMIRVDRILDHLKRTTKEARRRVQAPTAYAPEAMFTQAARIFGVARVDDLDEAIVRVWRHNLDAMSREPLFLAIEGAFHGKSTGSLKLTFNPDYRSPWRRFGLKTVFLPIGDEKAIQREIDNARVKYLDIEIAPDGAIALVERDLVNISACFVEPIQGEGGIREIPADYLLALRRAADEGGFPLVMDEIQSGMGRTGTFLASEPSNVRADYYLLSKALGGGLVKVSALLVEKERYAADYGYLHTSTFADDDFSSGIALAALDLIERDDGALMKRCRERGDLLLRRLRDLQMRYPGELREVRGRGLMVGIELARQTKSSSPLLRVLSEQNLLGFIASGYLLHEEGIRVAPTLSAHGTIRLEPSAFVEPREIDRFCEGLERLLRALKDADGYRVLRYMVGRAGEAAPERRGRQREPMSFTRFIAGIPRFSRNVAFLGHYVNPTDVRHWDPSLEPFSVDDCEAFLDRTQGMLDPFVVDRAEVQSVTGDTVNLTVIGLSFTPRQVMEAFAKGETRWAVSLIEKGVALGKRLGCSVVGFGGYTSILTDNCRTIIEDDITVTSGNSLTSAAAVEALTQTAKKAGVWPGRLGVLGAAGNIGAVLAQVAADQVRDILLVGRSGAARRLEDAAGEVYFEAWKRLTREGSREGLAGAIADTATVKGLQREGTTGVGRIGQAIRLGLEKELGERAPVRVAADMDALRECNLILTATNSTRPVIFPDHLAKGKVVICDVATPRDVDPSVGKERPDVIVLEGGIVRAPLGQVMDIGGMPLPPGQVYGCLAESILLGFAGIGDDYSYGRLTANRVRWIRELARIHGFTIEEEVRR